MRTTTIRVIIADDHPVIRDGIRSMLKDNQDIDVVGMASNFDELFPLLHKISADIVILDLSGMEGVQTAPMLVVKRLRKEYPDLGIVIFSTLIDLAPEMFQAGVRGYVAKQDPIETLLLGVKAAFHQQEYRSPAIVRYLDQTASDPNYDRLLPRELMALKLLAQGLSTEQIADAMGIDPRSVQNYVTVLRRKTGSNGRQQLIEWYRRVYSDS